MKVNGIDISKYNAKKWKITPGKREISNASEMLDGGFAPVLAHPFLGMKEYTLEINIHGESRGEIWDNVSNVIKLFGMPGSTTIEGFEERIFKVSLKDASHTEYGPGLKKWAILTLTCVGYECGYPVSAELKDELSATLPSEDTFGGVCVDYEFYTEDITLKPLGEITSPRTTAPVPIDITVRQMRVCEDDGSWFSGMAGKKYPIYADVIIDGICRDYRGRDKGRLWIRISPEVEPSEMGMVIPASSGYGVESVKINGQTGQVECIYNREPPSHMNMKPECYINDMQGGVLWGFPGQKIKVSILSTMAGIYRPSYQISFNHTPIYL